MWQPGQDKRAAVVIKPGDTSSTLPRTRVVPGAFRTHPDEQAFAASWIPIADQVFGLSAILSREQMGWSLSAQKLRGIFLTAIRRIRRQGGILYVRGVDMLDGTPILDIKPYLSNIPEQRLRRGRLAEAETRKQQ
jgi:hypothetical protein